jgi:carboxymethylenebutenolidase
MALDTELVEVKASDGMMAALVYGHGDNVRRPAVLVMHGVMGVNHGHQHSAQHFRDNGYVAVAPDVYYRSGRLIQFPPGTPNQVAGQARKQVYEDKLVQDLQAVIDYLKTRPDVDATRIAIAGYCFGGWVTFLAGIQLNKDVKVAANYYGGVSIVHWNAPEGTSILLQQASKMNIPMVGFFGNLDRSPQGPDDVNTLEAELRKHGKTFEAHRYDGVGHNFMHDDREPAATVAADAWTKTFAFFDKHFGKVPAAAG